MTKAFPNHPRLSGNFSPLRTECDAFDLVVHGEMPTDLRGSLYRIGPDPQFAPRDGHHWFAGDGMVHGFHIEEGRAHYRNRWVRTPKWELERDAGRSLFGTFGNPMTSDPSVVGKSAAVANTNLVWHGQRLLTMEELHEPYEIEPDTLETIGSCTFDGALRNNMTAHPKLDPRTGEMFFFAYFADGMFSNTIALYVANRDGKIIRSDTFEAPFAAIPHDFLITEEHIVFTICPLTGIMERALAGGPAFAWEPELGTWVGVLRRDEPTENLRWFRTESCFVFHPMNGWTDGNRIVADMMQFEVAPLFPNADGSKNDPERSIARLSRWTLDLDRDTDALSRECIDDSAGEFPRIDERFAGAQNQHGFFAAHPDDETGTFNKIVHINHGTGEKRVHELAGSDRVSEPVFVPRSEAAEEGDGYLLATVYRAEENRSDLVVLDTDDIEREPIAIAELQHRVPYGFHGIWRPAA
jgi:carotenoid cleavage dioxygenase